MEIIFCPGFKNGRTPWRCHKCIEESCGESSPVFPWNDFRSTSFSCSATFQWSYGLSTTPWVSHGKLSKAGKIYWGIMIIDLRLWIPNNVNRLLYIERTRMVVWALLELLRRLTVQFHPILQLQIVIRLKQWSWREPTLHPPVPNQVRSLAFTFCIWALLCSRSGWQMK